MTPTGGDVLYIEAQLLPGGKGLTLTGQLGEVMRESAEIARDLLWAEVEHLEVDSKTFERNGMHVHVPAGAIPKDGPSAGIAMATALTSLLTRKSVRSDTAMTGELTLAGLVLPVGGIKEKVLAARRATASQLFRVQPRIEPASFKPPLRLALTAFSWVSPLSTDGGVNYVRSRACRNLRPPGSAPKAPETRSS